jgi:glycosyltransferase involved in cell wall biosynthesis
MVLSGDPAKRHFSLAARAVELLTRRLNAALLVVGNVDWRREASAARLKEKGRLRHVPATLKVEDFFAAADVFALPAYYEEFGVTVLEALASGCPPVVSARCGAAELITNGSNGYVFGNLKDPEELMEGLSKALALRGQKNSCRDTAELYSWERHAREVAGIYRELL